MSKEFFKRFYPTRVRERNKTFCVNLCRSEFMSHKKLFLLLYSLGIVFVICLVLGIILFFDGQTMYAWGERELLPQSTPHASIMQMPTQIPLTSTASMTATPAPLCGGPQKMILVLLGTDSRADSYYAGLADSIRLVRVDFMDPGLMVLPFNSTRPTPTALRLLAITIHPTRG